MKIITCKTYNPAPQRKLNDSTTKVDDISVIAIRYFFSQTNLVSNLTLCLLTYWIVFATIYLHSYLLIIDIQRVSKLMRCLFAFRIKTSKISMRLNILILKFSASKCSSYVLFSMKLSYLITVKITYYVNKSL